MKVKSLSCAQLVVTLWTVAHQTPLSMDFPGKSTEVGCHCLLQCADDTTLRAESEKELKSLLIKVKEESEKAG